MVCWWWIGELKVSAKGWGQYGMWLNVSGRHTVGLCRANFSSPIPNNQSAKSSVAPSDKMNMTYRRNTVAAATREVDGLSTNSKVSGLIWMSINECVNVMVKAWKVYWSCRGWICQKRSVHLCSALQERTGHRGCRFENDVTSKPSYHRSKGNTKTEQQRACKY